MLVPAKTTTPRVASPNALKVCHAVDRETSDQENENGDSSSSSILWLFNSSESLGDFIASDCVQFSTGAASSLAAIRLGGGEDLICAALQGMRREWLDDLQSKYTAGNNATETPALI
jgi:hypothetical protein